MFPVGAEPGGAGGVARLGVRAVKARPRLAVGASPGCHGRCHWLRRGGASRAPAAPFVFVGSELGKG